MTKKINKRRVSVSIFACAHSGRSAKYYFNWDTALLSYIKKKQCLLVFPLSIPCNQFMTEEQGE